MASQVPCNILGARTVSVEEMLEQVARVRLCAIVLLHQLLVRTLWTLFDVHVLINLFHWRLRWHQRTASRARTIHIGQRMHVTFGLEPFQISVNGCMLETKWRVTMDAMRAWISHARSFQMANMVATTEANPIFPLAQPQSETFIVAIPRCCKTEPHTARPSESEASKKR